MMTSSALSAPIGWVAVAVGTIQLIGLVFLIVFFMIGQPFGTLNDICIGLAGLLSGVLASLLFALLPAQPAALSRLALGAAGLGALIVAVGSVLVIFRITGWVLAGLYTEFGNAFIGLWLLALLAWARSGPDWPRGLVILGLITGACMALGLLTLPGILRGIDTFDAIPWYVNVGQASGLGWILLFPIWCLWLGRVLLSNG
jgi:hypothetical protein